MSHLNYEKSLLLLPTPLPKRSLFSIQICHSSQQTTPEGSICRKEMADTATHQRSSRQNHCEIPLHNHHEIASQIEVNTTCFKYRSSWNTLLGAITRETYLSAVCFVLFCPHCCDKIPDRSSLREEWLISALGFRYFLLYYREIGWDTVVVKYMTTVGHTVWSKTRKQKVQAEPWVDRIFKGPPFPFWPASLTQASFLFPPNWQCFPHPFTVPASGSFCFSASLCLVLVLFCFNYLSSLFLSLL